MPSTRTLVDLLSPIALILGLVSRAVTEPSFGSIGAILLIAGIAAGAAETISALVDVSDIEANARQVAVDGAPTALALTALMLYVAGGGIPSDFALVALASSIVARALGHRASATTKTAAFSKGSEAASSEDVPEVRRIA